MDLLYSDLKLLDMRRLRFIILFLLFYSFSYANGLRILFIGDSITDGNWGRPRKTGAPSSERNLLDMNHIYGNGYMYLCAVYYQSKYPDKNYEFFNRGISGNTLDDLEKRWENDVISLQPDILSILIGINDIDKIIKEGGEFDMAEWEQKYRSLIKRAYESNSNLKLVLCAPFVAKTGKLSSAPDYEKRLNLICECGKVIEKIANDYNAVFVSYFELFNNLQMQSGENSTYWIWDGIHPTPAGQGKMAELWLKCTDELFKGY